MFRSKIGQTDESCTEKDSYQKELQCKEDRLRFIFGPIEKYIYVVESVLTWEYPIVFVLFLAFLNFLFWLYSTTPFYCLIASGGFVALFIQFVTNHVLHLLADTDDTAEEWIKVRASSDDNLDLVHCLAVVMTKFEHFYKSWEVNKKKNRDKFNLICILIFSLVFLLSCVVNESLLFYVTVTTLVFLPGLKYNKISEKMSNFLKPYLERAEKKLKISRIISLKEGEEDDSDAELEQFIPNKEYDESFPSITQGNDDDSDTNDDFIPDVSAVTDSRDNTDDEFFPEDMRMSITTDSSMKPGKSDDGVSSEDDETNDKSSQDDMEDGTKDDEHFAEGLSFEDNRHVADDSDVKASEIESSVVTTSSLMGRAYNGLNTFYNMMNRYVPTSMFSTKGEKREEGASTGPIKTVDDEFDFLNQEFEDIPDP